MSNNLIKNQIKKRKEKDFDPYLYFFQVHFQSLEERFYGHICDLVISLTQIPFKFFCQNFEKLKRLDQYKLLSKHIFPNFGFCFLATDRFHSQLVILKPIINSSKDSQTKLLLQNYEQLSKLQNENVQKLLNLIIINEKGFDSIWYVFPYNESISLQSITSNLHKRTLRYEVLSESEFVHLLYSCNSITDQSKTTFPDFMKVIRYVAIQLLMGLSYLHSIAIIHKDLNPSYVRMTSSGTVKITDLGVAKRYVRLQYDGRSIADNCVTSKDSTKRLRLGGSYFYMDPNIRARLSKNDNCGFKPNESDSLGCHLDYFSASMILFEMTFGFTYGDLSLFKKYSFYEPFLKYELVFFFYEYYKDALKKLSNLSFVFDEFLSMCLINLKKFLMNQEEGFVDFLIDGLSTEPSRWSSYIKGNENRKYFDVDILLNKVPFFKEINLENMASNMPKSLLELIQISNVSFSHTVDQKAKTPEQYLECFQDSPQYLIPELPLIINNNQASNVLPTQLQPKITETKIFFRNHNIEKRKIENIKGIPKVSKTNSLTTDTKDNGMYTSVLLHKLFETLEDRNESSCRQSQPEPPKNHTNKTSLGEICSGQNLNNDPLSCINKVSKNIIKRSNVIGKKCCYHVKHKHLKPQKSSCKNLQKIDISLNKAIKTGQKPSPLYEQLNRLQYPKETLYNDNDNHFERKCSTSMDILPPNLENITKSILKKERKIEIKDVTSLGSSPIQETQVLTSKGKLESQSKKSYLSKSFLSGKRTKPIEMLFKTFGNWKEIDESSVKLHKPSHTYLPKRFRSTSLNNSLLGMHRNKQSKGFLDSDALSLFNKFDRKTEVKKDIQSSSHQSSSTIFGMTPYVSFPMLFDNQNTKSSRPRGLSASNVVSLRTKNIQTEEEEIRPVGGSNIEISTFDPKISRNPPGTDSTLRMNFAIENNLLKGNYDEVGSLLEYSYEVETLRPQLQTRIDYEYNFKADIQVVINDIICCNKKSYFLININDVEETLETVPGSLEKFRGVLYEDSFIIDSESPKINLKKKTVTFKFPLITDVFCFDSTQNIEPEYSELNLKSVLNEPDHCSDAFCFLRPKVNRENLDIIDDWMDSNKDFDLRTIPDCYLLLPK